MAMKPRSMKKKDDKKAKMMRGGTATKSNVGDMEKKLKRTEEAKAGASFKA